MSDTLILGKNAEYVTLEGEVASGTTVYPGMILEENGTVASAGDDTPTVQPVQTADEVGRVFRVALTPDTPPHANDSDKPIEHEYDAGEHVEYAVVYAGRIQNALLAAATNNNSTGDSKVDSYDDPLTTNDDGALAQHSKAGAIVARARESSVDNSGNAGDQAGIQALRIDVEVMK